MEQQHHASTKQHVQPQADNNGLAIASLVLGIFSLTGPGLITGIPAIITGAIGLKNPVNKAMSWAGIIMGAVSTVVSILLIGFFLILLLIVGVSDARNPEPDSMNQYEAPKSSFDQRRT